MQYEYREYRCCLCPNINVDSTICPGIQGTPHPEESTCRFVKAYIDERGRKYKVMIYRNKKFKAKYQELKKHGMKNGWKNLTIFSCRDNFDEAQSDLNIKARDRQWHEYIFTQGG